MIHPQRIRELNDRPTDSGGAYVLYWMQASQRTRCNHALEHAIALANASKRPLLVCFGLMDDYPEANLRHYAFMLQGLRDVERNLRKRGIRFVVKHGPPPDVALGCGKQAAHIVCDRGYTRHQRRWRDQVADGAACSVTEVESDVVVPVEAVSDHAEYAARTIRPKIHRLLDKYLVDLPPQKVRIKSLDLDVRSDIDVTDPDAALDRLKLDRSVQPVSRFIGGEDHAAKHLDRFLETKLSGYDEGRNEPSAGHTSTMSPYLQFGNISPLQIALAVKSRAGTAGASQDAEAYLEELIVRRELSANFLYYTPNYDSYDCLPDWAKKTLAEHARDPRPRVYSRQQLEEAKTADPYWNAAQLEMVKTGFMHNYMRMYWGKKILEWSKTPRTAYETVLGLNNKYFLDGRSPNAYANVAWVFGLHDRPWGPARPVYGTVRYMNANGLERKFDMESYVRFVDSL